MSSHLPLPAESAARSPDAPGVEASPGVRLRLWPALLLCAVQWILITVPRWLIPGTLIHFYLMFSPAVVAVFLALWWGIWSQAPKRDRWLTLGIAGLGGVGAALFSDRSAPLVLFLVGLPTLTTAWTVWLAGSTRLKWSVRRLGLFATILLACGYFTLIRVDGTDGNISAETSWRWAPTKEERLLRESPLVGSKAPGGELVVTLRPGDWPGFRGASRDSRVAGVQVADDWTQAPPPLVWKTPIGPGWGSFAVVGGRLFTQEQRGEEEVVACYRAMDGELLWAHQDRARFWEVIAGTGPRATPTFHDGLVYAVGANGNFNCLDAASGECVWSTQLNDAAQVKVPEWGYSCSPLVVGEVVVVLPGRPDGGAVQGYDRRSGERLWSRGAGTHSYSSPQLVRFEGIPQVLALTDAGLSSLLPQTGEILWTYSWPTGGMHRVIQPGVFEDSVVVPTYFGIGSRRVRISRKEHQWNTELIWETKDLKPYYNDFVELKGSAYGFDANIFCCIDLATGKRRWKGGRYGYGQVLLLQDQERLLVLSESGEAVVHKADPERHVELGRFQALEGKTWNHPVIVGNRLYLRNAEMMACYDLAPQ
ncbi:MAG: PQQ-binding-like beta-propeller repeat protein [Planctomycetales bacterium]